MKTLTLEQFHAEMKAQGVASHNLVAFKCPKCGTVQSMASLMAAGVPKDKVESYIGFSCEGRWREGAPEGLGLSGSAPSLSVRGCNWTLGGLFQLHTLEVVTPDGEHHPRFELASPEEAQALAQEYPA